MSSSGRKGVTKGGVKTGFLKDVGCASPEVPFAVNVHDKNGKLTRNATPNGGIMQKKKSKKIKSISGLLLTRGRIYCTKGQRSSQRLIHTDRR